MMPVIRDNLDLTKQARLAPHPVAAPPLLQLTRPCLPAQPCPACLAHSAPCRAPCPSPPQDIGGASIAAVTGAVFSRILLGAVCDSYGPRYGHGVLQLLTASATFGMAAITNSAGFIVCRM